MTWQDFWSTTFPAYLGALGSIAASSVAVAAFIRDLRTRAGLKEVAQTATSTIELAPATGPGGAQNPPTIRPPRGDTRVEMGEDEPRLELTSRGNQTVLLNMGAEPIRITALRVPSAGKTLMLRNPVPGSLGPGEGFGFVVHDLLGGPAVAALLVEWVDSSGTTRLSRFFV